MNYCTADDVSRAIGAEQLADILGVEPGDLSADIAIADAVAAAESRINGYLLQAGYALPVLVSVPTMRRAAIDMSVYYLFSVRRMGDIKDVLTRYQEHVNWLEAAASGNTKIAELEVVSGTSAGNVVVIAPASSVGWGGY